MGCVEKSQREAINQARYNSVLPTNAQNYLFVLYSSL
jgi:hypothetical protein